MRPLVALTVFLVLAGASCARSGPPNVLVLVVDTLRADRLGAYGNRRGLTPFLDQLAQHGTVFANAYAPSSWTVPSVASLMTSRHSSQHHVVGFTSRLADDEVTFAEALQPLHFVAGGFSANRLLLQPLGFAQGFQYWRPDKRVRHVPSAPELRQQGLQWLDSAWHAGLAQPVLLYFQFMEPHSPYEPPEPFRSQALGGESAEALGVALGDKLLAHGRQAITRADMRGFELLYDGEVATLDAEIKVLFAELERRGFLDNAIVIITADHGEEFWEHEDLQHGKTLFDESVRVPFLLIAPGYQAGQRIEESVSLVDVGPTLVDLAGLPPEPRFEGRSLVPLLKKTSLAARLAALLGSQRPAHRGPDVILELKPKTGNRLDNRKHVEGIVRESTKLLVGRDGRHATYDLATDPAERNPNPRTLEAAATNLAAALDETQRKFDRRAGVALTGEEIDEATKETLRALGYDP